MSACLACRPARALLAGLALACLAPRAHAQAAVPRADSDFARLVGRVSEPGGYFDTDNLISNESSYLHAVGRLRALRRATPAGAYVGVGPDQSFSYIAALRPTVAFIVDIRRDNLLEHLLFKALFALSRTRVEYLTLLTGRRAPADVDAWRERAVEDVVKFVDAQPRDTAAARAAQRLVLAKVRTFGLALSDSDLATIRRFHAAFIADGLDLRFTSFGRAPRPYYPTYRQLVLEKDLAGRRAGFLAAEDDFRYVQGLEARGLVVPVVGDLAGPKALPEIAKVLAERGEPLAALYTSNVEFYLLRQGTFARFAENVKRLPARADAVIVRSYFGFGGAPDHPQAVPGYASVQTVTRVDDFLAAFAAGRLRTYEDVTTDRALDPRIK